MMIKRLKLGERKTAGERVMKLGAYIWFAAFSICVLLPFYIMLVRSFTSETELAGAMEFSWFPKLGATLEGYKEALTSDKLELFGISIFRGFLNTLWQTLPPLLIGLFVSGLAAFAYSKLRFPGKRKLYALTIATMMIPGAVLTVPSYLFYDAIGWSGTVLPLIIPGMFGGATTVFFLHQFFKGIPTELLEAAKIDGLGFMGQYVRIVLPLAKPAFISQFIFGFVGGYNSYAGPLLYLNGKPELYPLSMALTLYNTGVYRYNPGVVAALTILSLVPLLIIYIIAQKWFVEGIASSGVKG